MCIASTPEAKRTVAQELIARLWRTGGASLSIQVLSEIYWTVTRKSLVQQPQAAQIVRGLARWNVHQPSPADVLAAIDLGQRFQLSYWDAMIVRSAQQLGAHILWTEDLQDGQRFGDLVVRNPFAGVASA